MEGWPLSAVYLGTLEQRDPLYGYIKKSVMPEMERDVKSPVFHVSRLPGSNIVYKYHEERSRLTLIGKFYCAGEHYKKERLTSEFKNLRKARALGLCNLPHYVVRPVGRESSIGLGIMEEFVEGNDLDHYIKRAVYEGRHKRLRKRLTDLARFIAELHKRTMTVNGLDFSPSVDYFGRVLSKLREKGIVDDEKAARLTRLREAWVEREYMLTDGKVLIHGDATPTNFLFPKEDGVIAIDLERMRMGDRMFDVGMVCGELKHAFIWRMGDKYASEEHIAHFLGEYARHFGGHGTYRSVVLRNPFYMALTELRIARNGWLDRRHRYRLVEEAEECLRWGLRLE
jgi:aminoglycoside phosphotransferase (APT) family kinase protein